MACTHTTYVSHHATGTYVRTLVAGGFAIPSSHKLGWFWPRTDVPTWQIADRGNSRCPFGFIRYVFFGAKKKTLLSAMRWRDLPRTGPIRPFHVASATRARARDPPNQREKLHEPIRTGVVAAVGCQVGPRELSRAAAFQKRKRTGPARPVGRIRGLSIFACALTDDAVHDVSTGGTSRHVGTFLEFVGPARIYSDLLNLSATFVYCFKKRKIC